MFDRAGIDISGIRKAIAPTALTIFAARQADIPIVYLKMAFHPTCRRRRFGQESAPSPDHARGR
jgi:hypothetical protein